MRGNMTVSFDEQYKVILKTIYKHFNDCAYLEERSATCEICSKYKTNILDKLSIAPVFILPTEAWMTTAVVESRKQNGEFTTVDKMVEVLSTEVADMTGIDSYIQAFNNLDATIGKGLPFSQFLVVHEEPHFIKEIQSYLLGYLYYEYAPNAWLHYNIAMGIMGNISIYVSTYDITSVECRIVECLLNSPTYVELSELNTKVNIGYYNKQLPRNAKAKPIHVVYIGTKKDFIHKHPQYETKILREPKLAHLVRGHWRKLHDGQKHGKDRHGYPIFNGYTWVIPHKRGKGDLPETTIYVAQ